MPAPRLRPLTALLLTTAIGLSACSSDDDPTAASTPSSSATVPATVAATSEPPAGETAVTPPDTVATTDSAAPAETAPDATEVALPVEGELVSSVDVAAPTGVDATTSLITYAMEGAAGAPVQATALVMVPRSAPPAGGRPIVVWAGGAVGVADRCAASASPDLAGQASFVAPMVAAGAIVVAPDYEGLGVDGPATFRDVVSQAHAVAGSVRAVRAAVADAGDRWGVVGFSLGGQAAIAAAEHADWAGDGTFVGAVAIAPAPDAASQSDFFDARVAAAVAAGDVNGAALTMATKTALLGLAIEGLGVRHPELTLEGTFGDRAALVEGAVADQCVVDLIVFLVSYVQASVAAGGAVTDYPGLRPGWYDDPAVAAALAANRLDGAPPQGPLVIVHGPADQIVPNTATLDLVAALTTDGADVTYVDSAAPDHYGMLASGEAAAARDALVAQVVGGG